MVVSDEEEGGSGEVEACLAALLTAACARGEDATGCMDVVDARRSKMELTPLLPPLPPPASPPLPLLLNPSLLFTTIFLGDFAEEGERTLRAAGEGEGTAKPSVGGGGAGLEGGGGKVEGWGRWEAAYWEGGNTTIAPSNTTPTPTSPPSTFPSLPPLLSPPTPSKSSAQDTVEGGEGLWGGGTTWLVCRWGERGAPPPPPPPLPL